MYYRVVHSISWNIQFEKKPKSLKKIISLIFRGQKHRKQETGWSTNDPSDEFKPYNLKYMY